MKKYFINKGFIIAESPRRITILDSEESVLYLFNETAAYIFRRLRSGWRKERIIDRLTEKFVLSRNHIANDTDGFIRELLKNKIITERG